MIETEKNINPVIMIAKRLSRTKNIYQQKRTITLTLTIKTITTKTITTKTNSNKQYHQNSSTITKKYYKYY